MIAKLRIVRCSFRRYVSLAVCRHCTWAAAGLECGRGFGDLPVPVKASEILVMSIVDSTSTTR